MGDGGRTPSAAGHARRQQRNGHGARRSGAALAASALVAGMALTAVGAFVPAARWSGRSPPGVSRAATPKGSEDAGSDYAEYDWQRVAQNAAEGEAKAPAKAAKVNVDALPDLPDLDDSLPTESNPTVGTVGARVKVREVNLPDLPGGEDLLPPTPNPVLDGGLGFFEWAGVWLVVFIVIGAIGGAGSYFLARANLDITFARDLQSFVKTFFTVFQVLFFARVILTQFPRIKTQEMPWAPVHYATEWVLAPTRSAFPPEAGVDIAPVVWLVVDLLGQELLTGSQGVLTLIVQRAPLPAGF